MGLRAFLDLEVKRKIPKKTSGSTQFNEAYQISLLQDYVNYVKVQISFENVSLFTFDYL
jgi:hypothetical protein